jgi:flavodoxin
MKLTKSKLREIIKEVIDEVSPPGWGGTVKAMKKHKDIDNPWALAWHMKGKGDKPHYKDKEGSPKKYKKYKHESINEAREIGGYYLMKQLKGLAHDAKRSGEKKVAKALMFLHDRINQSSRDIDLNADDLNDFLNDPRGRKYAKDLPDWMIDDLFEGKVKEWKMNTNLKTSKSDLPGQKKVKKAAKKVGKKLGAKGYEEAKVNEAMLNKSIYAFKKTSEAKDIKGKDAGNYVKMAPKGRKITMKGKTYTSLGKGKWKGPKGEKLDWIEISSKASALGNKTVQYEATKINVDALLKNKKVKEIMKRLGIKISDAKSTAKIVNHFMRNPTDLKAIGA